MKILKLHNYLLSIFSIYCICIGVSSYYYDYRIRRHIQYKFTRYYATLVNVITVLTTPVALYYAFQIVDSFSLNFLMKYTNYVNLTTCALTILYISIFRWLREQQHLQLRQEMLHIDPDYLNYKSPDEDVNPRLRYLYYIKFAVFTFQNILNLCCSVWLEHFKAWQKCVVTVVVTNMLNILICSMFNYFLFMWWVCLIYQQLNTKLWKFLTELCDGVSGAASTGQQLLELQQLRRVHWHITNIAQILSRISQFQLLANICACMVSNIVNGYYGIMFLFAYKEPLKWSLVVLGGTSYMILFVDIYLFDIMCDDVIRSYQETSTILRSSCELPLQQDIHNFCDQFALQLISRKFCINLCGLFQINKMNTFNMIVQTIFYVILLLQFDFILNTGKDCIFWLEKSSTVSSNITET